LAGSAVAKLRRKSTPRNGIAVVEAAFAHTRDFANTFQNGVVKFETAQWISVLWTEQPELLRQDRVTVEAKIDILKIPQAAEQTGPPPINITDAAAICSAVSACRRRVVTRPPARTAAANHELCVRIDARAPRQLGSSAASTRVAAASAVVQPMVHGSTPISVDPWHQRREESRVTARCICIIRTKRRPRSRRA
jgi:hypothetical protein